MAKKKVGGSYKIKRAGKKGTRRMGRHKRLMKAASKEKSILAKIEKERNTLPSV